MSNVLGNLFGEIADAIRVKTGGTDTMKPAEFAAEIAAIPMGSGGSGEWISASGTFEPSSNTFVLNHNLGAVPDIFFINYNATDALTGSSTLFMCGMILSKKLMGDASSSGMGYSFLFNPNTKVPFIVTFPASGIEAQSAGSMGGMGGATATQITLGSNIANLIANSGNYKWTAYARV